MKIKKLILKKYKRFLDLTIDLSQESKRIVALVGPNGCGKSSIFDAMLFHSNAFGHIGNTHKKGYLYHSLEKHPNYDYKNVVIEFDEGDFISIRNDKA